MRLPQILVVDDNPFFRKLFAQCFEREGYEVWIAADGQEALEIAAIHPPDLVLTDEIMPRVTGIELCNQLRDPLSDTNIPYTIVATATPESEDPLHVADMGVDLYIEKKKLLESMDARCFRLDRLPFTVRRRIQIESDFLAQIENARYESSEPAHA